jgi:hypothetical protein
VEVYKMVSISSVFVKTGDKLMNDSGFIGKKAIGNGISRIGSSTDSSNLN